MHIKKILVKNYKLLKDAIIEFKDQVNIFVGENDAGKSTILEVLSILTTGKLNGISIDRQIRPSMFNKEIREVYISALETGQYADVPKITLEAYLDDCNGFSGTNNLLGEDCAGIHIEIALSENQSETYRKMLKDSAIKDIPVELYYVDCKYFDGSGVSYRYSPLKSIFIDTTRKDYSNIIDRFVSDSISEHLTPQEKTDLATAYRNSRQQFHDNNIVKELNKTVQKQAVIPDRNISIDLKEETADDWKKQMSVVVDDTPFESIGFGTQNTIKIELAMKNASEQANIVMIEEPENNLSFTNMARLVNHIIGSKDKQVFISTHSSYIANKLSLDNVILMHHGVTASYARLNEETKKYFVKLPGYDTLRFVLAEKVILVEGPTDDLIIQRAYKDSKGHFPIDDGIDILVVDSLAFKRFCDIAELTDKKVVIVTDNDRDIKNKIEEKYKNYLTKANLTFIYEKKESLHTIEPSVLAVNLDEKGEPSSDFKKVISENNSMKNRNYDEVLHFMTNNKVEWAFRVFDAEEKINYPEYVKDVIKQFD